MMLSEEKINKILPKSVFFVWERFENAGEESYLVGGSLRDIMLGAEPHDFDIATSAEPLRTAEIFSDKKVILTGEKHGTVTVIIDSQPIEITTFRVDGSYTDSRHPDKVSFTRSIEEDLSRRDFTVNAMAYNPRAGIVDPFCGSNDLKGRIIRAVGDAETRFTEDALRIMRAFRFSAQLGFEIEEKTLQAASTVRMGLKNIAWERISSELIRLLTSPDPTEALTLMIDSGVLDIVTGGYIPTEKTIALIKDMQRSDISRLGLFLSDTEESEARNILSLLRCSNRQITGALAVRRGGLVSVRNEKEARHFCTMFSDHAQEAIRASVLLGNSERQVEKYVLECRAPRKIEELNIGGKELIAMGAEGRQIGEILEELFYMTVDDPSVNDRERLAEIAAELIRGDK